MPDNQNINLSQQGSLVIIFDTANGNARIRLNSVSAREFMARDPRYVEKLTSGVPGPLINLESYMLGN